VADQWPSHDMATHDVTTGTGGLDASIRFWQEQARPENPGELSLAG